MLRQVLAPCGDNPTPHLATVAPLPTQRHHDAGAACPAETTHSAPRYPCPTSKPQTTPLQAPLYSRVEPMRKPKSRAPSSGFGGSVDGQRTGLDGVHEVDGVQGGLRSELGGPSSNALRWIPTRDNAVHATPVLRQRCASATSVSRRRRARNPSLETTPCRPRSFRSPKASTTPQKPSAALEGGPNEVGGRSSLYSPRVRG